MAVSFSAAIPMQIEFNFHYRMCNFFHLLSEILIDLSLRGGRQPDEAISFRMALCPTFGGEIATPLFGARNDRFLIAIPMKIEFNFHYGMCNFFHLLSELLASLFMFI
ncbi:MAG: hypothetical protein GYA26_06080 [Flexilinea flocculi]|nr:hypothetical protein [Flexilinea flocculi]